MIKYISILSLIFLISCGNEEGFQRFDDYKPLEPIHMNFPVKAIEKTNSRVDILWVIDNSGSMSQLQQNVIRNTNIFMREFDKKGGIDWKMGLLSTDEDELPFIGFDSQDGFNYQTPDRVNKFTDAVRRLGVNGAYIEKTFKPIMDKLSTGNVFVREDALLVIINVTDVHEQSNIEVDEFKLFLTNLKNNIERVKFYGAYGVMDFNCASEGNWRYSNSKYKQIVEATGGSIFPACAADFGARLTDLAKEIISYLKKSKIVLQKRPKPSTIRISYKGKNLPSGPQNRGGMWYYNFNDNAIVFYSLDFAPGAQEEVVIDFEEDDGL